MRSSYLRLCRMFIAGFVVVALGVVAASVPSRALATSPNSLLTNGSFENGTYSPSGTPTGWTTHSWDQGGGAATFTWDNANAVAGTKSVKISTTATNDSYWSQVVGVQPNTNYILTGWIKTQNVVGGNVGATLGLFGQWGHSPAMLGTNNWTYVTFAFNSGTSTTVEPAARIGFWGSTASGTVWFDDLRLEKASCDTSYPQNYFRGCFFSGTSGSSGTFLGSELEANVGSPAPARKWALNREWPSGTTIAGGLSDSISGVWRGSFNFAAGRYLFSLFADDGVRFYIDETLVLDQWIDVSQSEFGSAEPQRYPVARQLTAGWHQLRIEWYDRELNAQIRLQWDKGPNPTSSPSRTMIVDAFIVKRQDVCIAGQAATGSTPSANRFRIVNSNGSSVFKEWYSDQSNPDPSQRTPKVLKKSQEAEARALYPLVYCFSFGMSPAEITTARNGLAETMSRIQQWSFGTLVPQLEITELQGEIGLTFYDNKTLWVDKVGLPPATKPYVTSDTDMTFGVGSNRDVGSTNPDGSSNLGRTFDYPPQACGKIEGADSGLWGTGYFWVTLGCSRPGVMVSEWGHGFRCLIRCVLDFKGHESFDTDTGGASFPDNHGLFPNCGQGPADPFTYYPPHYEAWRDPAGTFCGWPYIVPSPNSLVPTYPDKTLQLASNLMWHWDPSLSHYPVHVFTGNHCSDGRMDFDESGVDVGSNCPRPTAAPTVTLVDPMTNTYASGTYNIWAQSDNFTKYVEIRVDGVLVKTDTAATYEYAWNTVGLAEGSVHTISVKAYDWSSPALSSPTVSASVTVANQDTDADGFPNLFEQYMGTDPNRACSLTSTANDEPTDSLPVDFNDDRVVNDSDYPTLLAKMGSKRGDGTYAQRYDLNADGYIDTYDWIAFVNHYGATC